MASKSTFDEEEENNDVKHGAFPTFRAIPSGTLKVILWLGRGCKKNWHYLLGIIIIIALTYSALDIYATAQLNHQLILIRQKGEPLILAEAAPPKISDSQNAAILYERAGKTLKLRLKQKYLMNGMKKKERDAIIAQNTDVIALIRQATAKPKCRFDVDWNHPFNVLFPEVGYMHQLALLLSWQARHEAESGDTNAALRDVNRLFIMSRHLSEEPVMISALVASSIETLANDTMAKVLLQSYLSVPQARDIKKSIPLINWNKVWYHALITERTFTLENFRDAPHMTERMSPDPSFSPLFWLLWRVLLPLKKIDETYSLQIWQMMIDNASKPRPAFSLKYNFNFDEQIMHTPWYAVATKIVLPQFSPSEERSNHSDIQRRQREIALALAAYHTQYHHYPTTLAPAEDLWKSAFPLDPYSNKPFRYKSEGKTFLLYSVGMDGKDNGGKWRENSALAITSDIVWGH